MSTPKLRDNEFALPAFPRATCVTTTINMPTRRYHYVAGALVIWGRTDGGDLEPRRMTIHTQCRQWISSPSLLNDPPFQEICDLCMLHWRRSQEARAAQGQVDF